MINKFSLEVKKHDSKILKAAKFYLSKKKDLVKNIKKLLKAIKKVFIIKGNYTSLENIKQTKIRSDINLRKAVTSEGALYHLTGKVVFNNLLVVDEYDEHVLLLFMLYYCMKYNGKLLSIVITDTHYHAIIKVKSKRKANKISEKIFRQTNSAYAQYFNARYHRKGTLFTSSSKSNREILTLKHVLYLIEKYYKKNHEEAKGKREFIKPFEIKEKMKDIIFARKAMQSIASIILNDNIKDSYKRRIGFLILFESKLWKFVRKNYK